MNRIQYEVAKLEAQQRARRAIEAFKEAMAPQGVPTNASNIQPQLPDQINGQRPDSSGQNVLSEGNVY